MVRTVRYASLTHPTGYATGDTMGNVSLARALSKLGVCSRSTGEVWVREGRVSVDGLVVRDPSLRVDPVRTRLAVDGEAVGSACRVYLMLNKPRGLVTTADDEQGRDTVYRCLPPDLPWVGPVGRLDKASEGLLLFSNDSRWAARLTNPRSRVEKVYHVQIDRPPDPALPPRLEQGVVTAAGERLRVVRATLLRGGARTSWIEVVLDEGRNRQVRRVLEALGVGVLRLVRVAIGPLALGDLPKGGYRVLHPEEIAALDGAAGHLSGDTDRATVGGAARAREGVIPDPTRSPPPTSPGSPARDSGSPRTSPAKAGRPRRPAGAPGGRRPGSGARR